MDGNFALEKLNYSENVFSVDMVFNVRYFSHQIHTHSISFLHFRGGKKETEHFLVTDIISLNTHFRVRNTYYDMTQTTTHSKQNTNQIAINS
jgi:hypothetical protein